MKKLIVALAALPLLISGTSCIKDTGCQDKTIQSEVAPMQAYATANGMNGITHSSGIYYEITTPGTGPNAAFDKTVTVRYTGKFLDNTIFQTEQGTPVTVQVGGVIPGWQVALQLLNEGGKMRVLIPSALGYGCSGKGSIPGNAVLYFDIELVDIL
jgi:FKBP-type peptidyl-prolyl cis-trans isomerase FkpA